MPEGSLINKTARWIRWHQVSAYFLLTFGMTWACWILGFVLFPEDELLQAPFIKLGVFASALVSIFISGVIHHETNQARKRPRWVVFGAVWLIAWLHLVLYAAVVSNVNGSLKLIAVSGIVTTLPAFVVSSAFSQNQGIRNHLASILKPAGSPGWYLVAIFIIPAAMGLGIVISNALGVSIPEHDQSMQDSALLQCMGIILLVFFNEVIQAGGLPEEPGWRGFALPRLQNRFVPLVAGTLLGCIWALWHGPLLIGMLQEAGLWRLGLRILVIGITFTWLYNRTQGSLMSMILLHASWNTSLALLPRTDAFLFLMVGLQIVLVVIDRMWEKNAMDRVILYREPADMG